jgi:hypothetical protein
MVINRRIKLCQVIRIGLGSLTDVLSDDSQKIGYSLLSKQTCFGV